MIHIDRDNYLEYWGQMWKGLARALNKTNLGLIWDEVSAKDALSRGSLLGFYDPTSQYSGLYMINQAPVGTKYIYWFWSGRAEGNSETTPEVAIGEYFENIARIAECSFILGEGRPGFKGFAKDLGFSFDSQVWLKEV